MLLTGYVLGAAPGFAVGAVAALASNVVFGQGPWTPWQMAGWGLVGLIGAGLGAVDRAPRRALPAGAVLRAGRARLRRAARRVGLGRLQRVSTRSGSTLLVSGSSLPFNIAHAVGNFVFCLAFGPAFVRALERFRTRLDVVWSPA